MSKLTRMCIAFMFSLGLYFSGAVEPRSHNHRQLIFPKGCKFFIRLNIRENIFDYTTIFAQASGFKVTWSLPETTKQKSKITKREIHQGLQDLFERHNIDGKACIQKFICDGRDLSKTNVILRILLRVLGSESDDDESCENLSFCPFSLFNYLHFDGRDDR